MREIMYLEAIKEALAEELERDEKVFIIGEGVQTGAFGTTSGLVQRFGPERIMDAPLSETAIAGVAVGASLMGYRPVADMMFADFLYCCADEVFLKAPQWRLIQGGSQSLPCVFMASIGGYRKLGNEHSQCPTYLALHNPGIKCVCPSNPYDAKGLLKTAIRDNNPVLFLHHKGLLGMKGEVPTEDYTVPFGQAAILREGTDVTIVATSFMTFWATAAADLFAGQISCEVIDPRTLEPFDLDTVLKSLEKTNRLVIIDEDTERCGFAAELGMQIMEHGFDLLDAPVQRVCAKNYPIPGGVMEKYVLPQPEWVLAAIEKVMQ
ncbi:Transketolase domain protein [Desulfarculus baarsii DSM 2075]|uniref:Transketolase domain protein n=1 Tax=Desulfarculus baarsii (strain ATCC 33931 / DSM 2075 / LMG 7858 / VKM B-1802 / 2st14) TaxID=644282 RepID=E1QKX3_DESB2|nr:alpha-ketoacid dehydrogenase subunit beta [Desulfarculus baarsii]ADK86332.1 Transketolase domain protein [Desulfarculus baarsii DSM 2075]